MEPAATEAEHLRAERPDSRHPVAVEAPDEIVPDKALELVPTHVHPLARLVLGQPDEPGQRRVDDVLAEPHDREDGHRQSRRPDRCVVALGRGKATQLRLTVTHAGDEDHVINPGKRSIIDRNRDLQKVKLVNAKY